MVTPYEIVPYMQAAGIQFGVGRSEVHAMLGNPLLSFNRGGEQSVPPSTEKYASFFVEYSCAGCCESVEFFEGDVELMGRSLLHEPYAELLPWLAELDAGLLCDDSGCTSLGLGIGIYVPNATPAKLGGCNQDGEPLLSETVIAFRRGYYASLVERYPDSLGESYASWIGGGRGRG